ncbi:MAG: hypothetical protein ACTSYL_09995 [Candidatus Thorarchaeota archaeon]
MTSKLSDCTPLCKSFRCDRRPSALKIIRKGGKKVIWCTWVDDECDGPWCQFGVCKELKMTADGKCKKSVPTPKPRVPVDDDDFVDPDEIPEKIAKRIRIKGR